MQSSSVFRQPTIIADYKLRTYARSYLPMLYPILITLAVLQLATAQQVHYHESADELEQFTSEEWAKKYGKQFDQTFSGPLSFSHLTYERCLEDRTTPFDIAILGMPFDTAVTYRPGARFGPFAIRSGSRRQRELRGYTLPWGMDPFAQGVKVVDCGDVSLVDSRANSRPCYLLYCVLHRSRSLRSTML